jgi:hypothetical protein
VTVGCTHAVFVRSVISIQKAAATRTRGQSELT